VYFSIRNLYSREPGIRSTSSSVLFLGHVGQMVAVSRFSRSCADIATQVCPPCLVMQLLDMAWYPLIDQRQ